MHSVCLLACRAAQDRWRAVNAPHRVALVRAGATFINGKIAGRAADVAA